MKSISIVYKRPKTKHESNEKQRSDNKILVNNYYTHLLQKGLSRQQLLQKIRSQTAKASKLRDRKNIVSSLSIASLSCVQPALFKSQTARKIPTPSPIFHVKRSQQITQSLLTLKLRVDMQTQTSSPLPFRKTLKQSSAKHSQVKILSKIKCEKQTTVILSVDFIVNQFNFWSEEQPIQQSCVRIWKMLMPLANIIWLIRRQSTLKKLNQFAETKGLRIDGILQIQHSKRQSLTISYSNFESEVKLSRNHKIIIINAIKSPKLPAWHNENNQPEFQQQQFRSSLPIIIHQLTFIHFVRIDLNNKNRAYYIKKVLTQDLPIAYDLSSIFEKHSWKKGKILNRMFRVRDYDAEIQQNQLISLNTLSQLQKIKANLNSYFEQSFGLRTRLQGDSLTYIIGDMIKRNYNIAKHFYSYCQQIKEKNQQSFPIDTNFSTRNMLKKYQYNRKIYIWQL